MNRTLFLSPLQQAWQENVDDPSLAKFMNQLVGDCRLNILYQRIEQIELDDTDTRDITFANSATTDWKFLIVKCVGTAHLNIAALDTNGVTVINSKIPFFGTSIFPGLGVVSSYNLTSVQIEGDADSTIVEIYAAVSCEDDDSRLTTNE
jgi:hypothetical protein